MNCSICGKESDLYLCKDCVRKNTGKRTLEIWGKNRGLANSLRAAYFKPTLKSYDKSTVKKTARKILGLTFFATE